MDFGEKKEYKKGDIVVWRGFSKCIGRIDRKATNPISFESYVIDEEHDSLHISNLRPANKSEKKMLGGKQKVLL